MTIAALSAYGSAAMRNYWHSSEIQSHALALFLIYFVYQYPWGLLDREALIRTPQEAFKKNITSCSPSVQKPFLKTDIPSAIVADSDSDGEEGVDGEDTAKEALAKTCSGATESERMRFLKANNGNLAGATLALNHYISWHKKHCGVAQEHKIARVSTDNKDLDIWTEASAIAMRACGEVGESVLPRVVRVHQDENGKAIVDKTGHRIIQMFPAQMDLTLAKSSTYALAVALFLDKCLDREGLERITVCLDVRAGQGWPNTHALKLIPFMQQTTRLLLSLFPERLHKCLLYPVPSSFTWIWSMVSKVLDPLTRDKICLMSGSNRIVAPPPYEKMNEYMDVEAAHLLEHARTSAFR